MSTKPSTIDYFLDQLAALSGVTARKMFGEYALYYDGKVVALVCDDQLFLKITEPGKKLLGRQYREGFPYPGAKPYIAVDESFIENHEKLCALVSVTAEALPVPKKKLMKQSKPIPTIPSEINKGFSINEKLLWALDIPVTEMTFKELSHNLDIAYLDREGTDDWNLTPRQLLAEIQHEKTHAKRVFDAKIDYPLDIYRHKGKWIILDGVHRFTLIAKLGLTTVRVRKVSRAMARLAEKPKISK